MNADARGRRSENVSAPGLGTNQIIADTLRLDRLGAIDEDEGQSPNKGGSSENRHRGSTEERNTGTDISEQVVEAFF